mgnify:CR=1 FL=1
MATAGIIPAPSLRILEGPSTKTRVVGPDESIIDAYAPGGRIILDDNSGPVIQHAPVVFASPAIAQPSQYALEFQQVLVSEPLANTIGDSRPVPQGVLSDTVSVEARKEPISPVACVGGDKVLLHPGTEPRVETRESVPITENIEESAATTTELPAAATTEAVTSTNADLSGLYKADNFEQLYDDGSYRPEHY